MSDFKPSQSTGFKAHIQNEDRKVSEIRVMKLDVGAAPSVKDFSFNELAVVGKGDYAAVKAKYGALAATDGDRQARSTRDARFSMNPLLRDPMAVEDEERRVIDERVREQVAASSQQAHQEGLEQGYQAGLKKGQEEALQQFREQCTEKLKSFETMLATLDGLKSEIFKANERFLMELIFRISKSVILKDLSTDKEYLVRLSQELIDRVGIRDNLMIKISPQDQATIELLKAELPKKMGELKNLQFEVSDKITSGGCEIETQWNAIDATIDTQLAGLYEALVGEKTKQPAADTAPSQEGSST